ncbi:MAG: hypothetical protein JJT85_00695 [Chromatiales bacterium]|nr:hypothetical protein [Chromatiales bacterium]
MRVAAALGLLLMVAAGGGWLATLPDRPEPGPAPVSWSPGGGPPTLVDAIGLAQQRYAGTVIDAELRLAAARDTGNDLYEIKLLTGQGQVLRIRIDATDGSFLEVDGHGLVEARRP